jgi:hypothetical protein
MQMHLDDAAVAFAQIARAADGRYRAVFHADGEGIATSTWQSRLPMKAETVFARKPGARWNISEAEWVICKCPCPPPATSGWL